MPQSAAARQAAVAAGRARRKEALRVKREQIKERRDRGVMNGQVYRHLGSFDTVEEAAQAYARAHLREHGGPSAPPALAVADHFREEEGGEEVIDLEPFRSEKGNAGYKGVCWNSGSMKYNAQIYVNGAQMHLGYFKC